MTYYPHIPQGYYVKFISDHHKVARFQVPSFIVYFLFFSEYQFVVDIVQG
jgi:hypothetical protein